VLQNRLVLHRSRDGEKKSTLLQRAFFASGAEEG
jgi:hypothetical protein